LSKLNRCSGWYGFETGIHALTRFSTPNKTGKELLYNDVEGTKRWPKLCKLTIFVTTVFRSSFIPAQSSIVAHRGYKKLAKALQTSHFL